MEKPMKLKADSLKTPLKSISLQAKKKKRGPKLLISEIKKGN